MEHTTSEGTLGRALEWEQLPQPPEGELACAPANRERAAVSHFGSRVGVAKIEGRGLPPSAIRLYRRTASCGPRCLYATVSAAVGVQWAGLRRLDRLGGAESQDLGNRAPPSEPKPRPGPKSRPRPGQSPTGRAEAPPRSAPRPASRVSVDLH